MTLFRRSEPQYHIGEMELDGLLKLLGERYAEARDAGDVAAVRYRGAYDAFAILRGGGRVEYPNEFVSIFDNLGEESLWHTG